jgi:exodeoxyribonuclease V beta subunit
MSENLAPLTFPLHGSRLIEASAGTGKTWTIAALYLRLILGHGDANGFARPLLPSEILVMTFTRAATRELSDRIRKRLLEAADCFGGDLGVEADPYLSDLVAAYPSENERANIAGILRLAASSMDEAAIFTIDAWCQRMLREHAFDSGSLFDEELVVGEQTIIDNAVQDYWRQHVYPLRGDALDEVRAVWPGVADLHAAMKDLVKRAAVMPPVPAGTLSDFLEDKMSVRNAALRQIKAGWTARAGRMESWILAERDKQPKCFNGVKLSAASVKDWFAQLHAWAATDNAPLPWPLDSRAWTRLATAGMEDARSKDFTADIPDDFAHIASLRAALASMEPIRHAVMRHAAATIARRIGDLKLQAHQFGFDDLLSRLRAALEGSNGAALRARIVAQFPVAMIDEFQDTSPDQYRIFDLLYRVADNNSDTGLFLIGDPKQAIYGFRGADIHSYLLARIATTGRHYQLATNFRSTADAVAAVNRLFLHAEGDGQRPGHPRGAFNFRRPDYHPLPFEPVGANGRPEHFACGAERAPALTIWCDASETGSKDAYQARFADHCAQHIVASLNGPECGFESAAEKTPLRPADIAILVRDRTEARAVRRALQRRGIASVYLSDNDSVFKGALAADVSRWLQSIASPEDARLAHTAVASATFALPMAGLLALASDDVEWERWIEQLKILRSVWQRHGILAMMRRLIHDLNLSAKLLQTDGGERKLTDLLHLSELLQAASQRLDGQHALIRWLDAQIEGEGDGNSEERTVRLESDAELVKVVTVHKSKGLEYPLVYLPFAASCRPVTKRRAFCEFTDAHGVRHIDFFLSDDSVAAMDKARLEEDLRLMYVAVTRARHAVWLGVASIKDKLHQSAFGYLLAGGAEVPAALLMQSLRDMAENCPSILIEAVPADIAVTRLNRIQAQPALIDAPPFSAKFDRDWSIASYTSITRGLGAGPVPSSSAQEKLLDHDDGADPGPAFSQDQPWHRFPRGSLPGQFLHEQLEWLAIEGFACAADAAFDARLEARCERAGWGHRRADASAWMRALAMTPLPPLAAPLSAIRCVIPEMEFWFPTAAAHTRDLDALCRTWLLDGAPRAPLVERELQGMLKGYADLVFEHDGRYWVLDYKSNALAAGDAGYHAGALVAGMAAHRYDVQGLIYLLALHRLLRVRLGAAYDPSKQLGGAVFYFLRGVGNGETRGCHHLRAQPELLDAVDALFGSAAGEHA